MHFELRSSKDLVLRSTKGAYTPRRKLPSCSLAPSIWRANGRVSVDQASLPMGPPHGASESEEEEGELYEAEPGELFEEETPRAPIESSIYPPLPPGFMLVQQPSGKVCYQHLFSKVVVWSRPYSVPHEQSLERHEVPRLLRTAVKAVQRSQGAKRPLPAEQPPQAQTQLSVARPASKMARNSKCEPVRVEHTGCPQFDIDIAGKTPVMVLNEFCPKVLRCFAEIVTETTEDPANPYLSTIVVDGVVVARGSFSNKKASRQVPPRRAAPRCAASPPGAPGAAWAGCGKTRPLRHVPTHIDLRRPVRGGGRGCEPRQRRVGRESGFFGDARGTGGAAAAACYGVARCRGDHSDPLAGGYAAATFVRRPHP